MSNRMFKRVYGGDDLKKISPESEDEHPVTFSGNKSNASGKLLNPYELLNEMSESEAKDGDCEDEKKTDVEESSKFDDDSNVTKKKKKRKRPNKKKKRPGESGSDLAIDTELEDEEVLKQRLKSKSNFTTKKEKDAEKASAVPKSVAQFEEVFKLDAKFLNPEFELKKIFGAKVIRNERAKQGQRRIYRNSKLVMPKEQWPSTAGSGISMTYLRCFEGCSYFKYSHNQHYMDVQKLFVRAVNALNPDNILELLRAYPYHIDAHIQLSDVAKSAEDIQVAADLVEGGVYILENAFHARFNICNPLCRLEYKYQENRAFFILLFKHLTFVGQRACSRTALELCKRLLCLDPNSDPVGVTLMIDFYALKAAEYEWFIKLYNYWEKPRNMDQLPNFSYSVALAYHLLSEKLGKSGSCQINGTSFNKSQLQDKADHLIQYAILMFPSILLPLLDKINLQVDSRPKNHSYFNSSALHTQSRSLKLLCDLYVWRTYHVWKEQTVPAWLERNVKIVLDKVDNSDPIVKDYENKRKRRYIATTPRNILRHVLLTDQKDLAMNLPPELSKEPILNYDPLPPPDSVDIYNPKEFMRPAFRSQQHGGILQMLMNSVWNDLNAQPPPLNENEQNNFRLRVDEELGAEAEAGNNVRTGLQQSVTALLDAMRDLLSSANQRPEAEANAADVEYTSDSQDESN